MSASEIFDRLFSPSSLIEAAVTALLFAWIAGRLLGARKRSWKSIVVTGATGWLAAVFVTFVLLSGSVEDANFALLYLLLTLVFIMLATVVSEVWVKPGTRLATRTWTIPHPFKAIRRRYRIARRLAQISRIAARYGLDGFLGLRRGRRAGEEPTSAMAMRIRPALEEAGGMFVKLGQLAAGRADLIGEEAAAEFARLQDAVPPAPPDAVRQVVEDELGRSFDEVFAEFEWDPVGAASIGQAHLATLSDGQRVIVKVQRPGIAEIVDRDLQIVARLAAIAEARTSWGAAYGVDALAGDFADNLRLELDYQAEAENASQVGSALAHIDNVHVPWIDRDLSTSRVLVMELLDGVPLSHLDRAGDQVYDRDELAETILRASVEPMFDGERFHADPHPGNVFLLRDGRLGLVDFGATGRLDAFEQTAVVDIMLGLRARDPALLREAVLSVGILRRDVDGRALERVFARFMARHISAGAAPSSDMLNELLQMLTSFGITLPPSTGAMFRALVTLEGTVNTLRPGFPIIDAAQRIGGDLVRQQFGPGQLKELAEQEALKLAPVLRRIPRHLDRIATMVEQGEVVARVSLFSTERDVVTVRDLLGRVLLTLIGASFLLLSPLLITIDQGPTVSGETNLFDVLGYIGLMLGTVLLLRVSVSALRDTDLGVG